MEEYDVDENAISGSLLDTLKGHGAVTGTLIADKVVRISLGGIRW